MGSFLCVSIPTESRLENPMIVVFSYLSDDGLCDTCITGRAYLFLVDLVSPPPAKPFDMVLSVCRTIRVSRISSAFFPFLVDVFFESGCLLDGLLFLAAPYASFT